MVSSARLSCVCVCRRKMALVSQNDGQRRRVQEWREREAHRDLTARDFCCQNRKWKTIRIPRPRATTTVYTPTEGSAKMTGSEMALLSRRCVLGVRWRCAPSSRRAFVPESPAHAAAAALQLPKLAIEVPSFKGGIRGIAKTMGTKMAYLSRPCVVGGCWSYGQLRNALRALAAAHHKLPK